MDRHSICISLSLSQTSIKLVNMRQLLNVSYSDFKLVFRNPALRIFLAVPILVLLFIFSFLPYLIVKYPVVSEYIPFIMMAALMQCSTMFGFIYAMVLIDEKDKGVAKVYGILPIDQLKFLLNRLLGPIFYSSIFNSILLYFQSYISFNLIQILLISILSALITPILALLTTTLSKNKMEGMTWFKILNLFVNLPLAAFFLPGFSYAFGVLPTFWPFQALFEAVSGESIYVSIVIGLVFCLGLTFYLGKRFSRTHFF